MKNLYYFEFFARQVGALGVCEFTNAAVFADTEVEAINSLYDKYEHISIRYTSIWPREQGK